MRGFSASFSNVRMMQIYSLFGGQLLTIFLYQHFNIILIRVSKGLNFNNNWLPFWNKLVNEIRPLLSRRVELRVLLVNPPHILVMILRQLMMYKCFCSFAHFKTNAKLFEISNNLPIYRLN